MERKRKMYRVKMTVRKRNFFTGELTIQAEIEINVYKVGSYWKIDSGIYTFNNDGSETLSSRSGKSYLYTIDVPNTDSQVRGKNL